MLRTLQAGPGVTTLTRAPAELGPIANTPCLLDYVDDEGYRRRIVTQLSVRPARQTTGSSGVLRAARRAGRRCPRASNGEGRGHTRVRRHAQEAGELRADRNQLLQLVQVLTLERDNLLRHPHPPNAIATLARRPNTAPRGSPAR